MADTSRPGLARAVHKWDLVAFAVNGIIGAGIFGLPSEVFQRIGVYSLLAFLVCGLLTTLIILCFAEVGSRFSGTGGPYLYAGEAFGSVVGFEVGWMMWVARVMAFAANTNLLVAYVGFFVPAAGAGTGRAAIIVALVAALTAVNVVGVRNAARVNNALAIAKLAPLALFVVAGGFFLTARNYAPGPPPSFGAFSVSVLLLVYAFSGFEMAAIPTGEAVDPGRDVPRALLMAIGAVAVFYIGIQVVAIGTLPTLGSSTRPLADAAGRFLGPLGAAIISAGALVSILGNLNVTLLVAARLPYAMAERGELPAAFARTHRRFRTPDAAILLTAAVMLVLTLSGTFVYAVTISVIARLLSYGATCAALPVFRRRQDAPPAQFLAPAGVTVSIVALALVGWLLSNSTGREARDATTAVALGLVIYAASLKTRRAAAVASRRP